jgi:hypothetical protein
VTDVRDVHDVGDAIPGRLERPPQDIFEHIGLEVPDMGKIIYGRSATIHPDVSSLQGFESFDRTGHRVVEGKIHGVLLSLATAQIGIVCHWEMG